VVTIHDVIGIRTKKYLFAFDGRSTSLAIGPIKDVWVIRWNERPSIAEFRMSLAGITGISAQIIGIWLAKVRVMRIDGLLKQRVGGPRSRGKAGVGGKREGKKK
jgi:hypothetical protein